MAKKIEAYQCSECNKTFITEVDADFCLLKHVRERCIRHRWEAGWALGLMDYTFGFHWKLTSKQRDVHKDNCFIIPYLQCCDKPAYRIRRIMPDGQIEVGGIGSWTGYYTSVVRIGCLEDPRPIEELYKDARALSH